MQSFAVVYVQNMKFIHSKRYQSVIINEKLKSLDKQEKLFSSFYFEWKIQFKAAKQWQNLLLLLAFFLSLTHVPNDL